MINEGGRERESKIWQIEVKNPGKKFFPKISFFYNYKIPLKSDRDRPIFLHFTFSEIFIVVGRVCVSLSQPIVRSSWLRGQLSPTK